MKIRILIFFLCMCCFAGTLFSQENNGLVEDNSELAPGENADEKIKKNFFLRAEVSKNECYVENFHSRVQPGNFVGRFSEFRLGT